MQCQQLNTTPAHISECDWLGKLLTCKKNMGFKYGKTWGILVAVRVNTKDKNQR